MCLLHDGKHSMAHFFGVFKIEGCNRRNRSVANNAYSSFGRKMFARFSFDEILPILLSKRIKIVLKIMF